MKVGTWILLLLVAVVPVGLAGCGSAGTGEGVSAEEQSHADEQEAEHGHVHDHDDHGHSHSHEAAGPHGGHLIELGDEAYHIEWSHDDAAKRLTFYVLDSSAAEEVSIPDENIKINLAVGEATTSYDVPAVREEGAEQTAKFEIIDPNVFALLEDGDVKGTIVVVIEGETLEGAIEHHHHGHAH